MSGSAVVQNLLVSRSVTTMMPGHGDRPEGQFNVLKDSFRGVARRLMRIRVGWPIDESR